MNSKANHLIDSVIEAVLVIAPKIVYASFLRHYGFNVLLHVNVHHLEPTLIGIVRNWHTYASKKLNIEKNVDNTSLNGVWRFLMNQRLGISFTITDDLLVAIWPVVASTLNRFEDICPII